MWSKNKKKPTKTTTTKIINKAGGWCCSPHHPLLCLFCSRSNFHADRIARERLLPNKLNSWRRPKKYFQLMPPRQFLFLMWNSRSTFTLGPIEGCNIIYMLRKVSLLKFRVLFQLDFRSPSGFDRTRNVEIGNKNFQLEHLEEAFTSEHWLVRIYR